MCYLVAKDRDAHGCFALKTTHGKHLVELKRELNQAVGYQGVQLVTISRQTAYGEYAPYHFVVSLRGYGAAGRRIMLMSDKNHMMLREKHILSTQTSIIIQMLGCVMPA